MISKFCINHKVTTILATILVVVFGIIFATQLQMALLPNIEAPMAVVYSTYYGANPGDIEQLLTEPLESAIMSVSGVKEISSTSSENVAMISITYEDDTDTDLAATKLREKFEALSLPDDASKPVIMNINVEQLMPTAMIALTGDDLSDLQRLVDDTVSPALERIDGVASVTVYGGVTEEVSVEIDPSRAAGLGLSTTYISQFLAANNLLYPGGDVKNGSNTLTASTNAQYSSVEDVANTLITLPSGGTVRLNEVADVAIKEAETDSVAKYDGENCVVLSVSKSSGANEVAVCNAVEEQMAALQENNSSIHYATPYLASDYIMQVVESALQNIVLGLVLAAIVVFLFLRKFGATLAIAVSMPVCVLTVFLLMDVFGLTLNIMTLGGIAMGVGMIVDNSIVVLENIYNYAGDGYGRMDACVEGTKEVTGSVIASTLTTVAVFVPLGLAGGYAGMLFKDFSLTIAFLILASLIIALTFVPLMCYFLLDETKAKRKKLEKQKEPGAGAQFVKKLERGYQKLLHYFVNHLWVGFGVVTALVAIFCVTCLSTNMVMLPDMDQGEVVVYISVPSGTDTEEVEDYCERVSEVIEQTVPERDSMYYMITGGGTMSMMSSGDAEVEVMLVDRSERSRTSKQVAKDLQEALSDIAGCEITATASEMTSMMSSGNAIELNITGADYDTLSSIAEDLVAQVSQLPDTENVVSSVSDQVPQIEVTILRETASQYGLTAATIGAAVRSELTGTTATTVTIDNKEYDVVVRGSGAAAESLDALRSMQISTAYGGYVALGSVAEVSVVQAPQSIARANQSRQVTVTGDTISGDTTEITKELKALAADYDLPDGYQIEVAGSYADMMDSFSDLFLALAVALGLVYFVLAVQFESFIMPVIVMLILPVAFSGALFSLPITGRDLSMISLVTLVMLAGTVVNPSIILVDYIHQRRKRGESREEAILHACPRRVRPVLMTTLTTVLAMIPMALALGGSNEMLSDMGIAMISGMTIATVVTLVFTPVFYCILDNFGSLFHKKKGSGVETEIGVN